MLHKALQVNNKQLILVEKISLRSEGLGFAEGHLWGGVSGGKDLHIWGPGPTN